MLNYSKRKDFRFSLKKFIPFYLLEILMTFTGGILSTATANYVISELNYETWIGGLVVSMTSLGFMFFTFFFGHIADKFGQKKVLRIIMLLKLIFSVFYLKPLSSFLDLIFFSVIFFLDGAMGGLFWPTIQHMSVHSENFSGIQLKQKYMSGYNFSWNFGYLLGMIVGALVVYIFNSNYYAFYLNTLGSVFGIVIAFFFVKNIPELFKSDSEGNYSQQKSHYIKGNSNHLLEKNEKPIFKLQQLPVLSILLILLIHSITDGVISIFLTLKIDYINVGFHWVFLINFIKLLFQMISSTVFSLTKEHQISKNIIVSILVILISWGFLTISNNLSLICLFFIFSGISQGIIYSSSMKIIAYNAKKQKSARAFGFFQTVMSGGRMTGAFIFGLTATFSLNLGIYLLLSYNLFSIIQFFFIIRKFE